MLLRSVAFPVQAGKRLVTPWPLLRFVKSINCRHFEPNGKACRRVAYRNQFYCHAHRHLYPDAETRTDYAARPKTWKERDPDPTPKQDADKGDERPVANADGPPLLFIIGIIVVFWIMIKLGDEGFFRDLPSGGGGCGLDVFGLCLAPFAAGGAALSRSSTGKFTHDPSRPRQQHRSLTKVTYCLHTKDNGTKCTRMVRRQSGLCYQHQDSDAAEAYLEALELSPVSADVLRYNVDGANKAISSKDIDGLIESLGEAKKFWVVDLGLDEAEFVQFTYDGDIDDDGIRDGQPVLEHWRGGRKILTNRIGLEKSLEILRSLLHGE